MNNQGELNVQKGNLLISQPLIEGMKKTYKWINEQVKIKEMSMV